MLVLHVQELGTYLDQQYFSDEGRGDDNKNNKNGKMIMTWMHIIPHGPQYPSEFNVTDVSETDSLFSRYISKDVLLKGKEVEMLEISPLTQN